MNLDLLRTFLAVHRTGSLTKAATHLGKSQPTVTVQIRTLERRIGKPLFVRLPRGVAPTARADQLARQLAPHIDALEALVESDVVHADPFRQPLYLGGPADLVSARVLPALSELVSDGLKLRTTLGLPEQLLDDLAAGRHDLVISTVRPRRSGVSATPLTDEEFVLVGNQEWAKRLPADVSPEAGAALDQVPLVSYAEELPLVRRYWLTVFGRRPPMEATVVVPDLRGVLSAVAAGAGISVLPRYLVLRSLDQGELILLHEPELPPINTLYLAVRRGGTNRPHVAAVHRHLLLAARLW